MVRQWEPGTPDKYAEMQREILQTAATALKPGGTMVYSTCTFAPEEDEELVAGFLAGHPQFSLVPVGGTGPFAAGLGPLPGAARLWPHKVKGKGISWLYCAMTEVADLRARHLRPGQQRMELR